MRQAFLRRETRQVAQDLTFSLQGTCYQILDVDKANRLRGKQVTVVYEGSIVHGVEREGCALSWRALADRREAVPVVGSKELSNEMSAAAQAWIKRRAPETAIQKRRRGVKGRRQ